MIIGCTYKVSISAVTAIRNCLPDSIESGRPRASNTAYQVQNVTLSAN